MTDLRLTIGRVLYTLHCRSQGPGRGSARRLAARGLAMLRWENSELRACQLFFLLPSSKVHTREYALFLQNFTALITPWEGKLPFFQRSHSGRALSDMEAETHPPAEVWLIRAVPPSPHPAGLMVRLQSVLAHFRRWLPFVDFFSAQFFIPRDKGKAGWPWT